MIEDAGCLVTSTAIRAALIHPLQVPLWIDLTAVVVGALAGAGVAARERFDVIGALLLAVVMGLDTARAFRDWLNDRIAEAETFLAERKQRPEKP